MKKIILVVLMTICLILPNAVTVSAKDQPVTITSCTFTASSAVITGETHAHAIMVRVKDDSNNIIALQSFAVSSD